MLTQGVTWDGELAPALARRLGVPRVELRGEVGSTQDVAHELAGRGVPAGTVVVADSQRAGRGRMGRAWSSRPGAGVWCTIIERPTDAQALDVLSLRVGLSVAEVLDEFTERAERVGVKWPNDLLLSGGKLAGILVETRWSGASPSWAAIGVGVNVMMPPMDDAAGLADGVNRVDVLTAIVRAVRSATARTGWLGHAELERYGARDRLVGRQIVSPADGTVVGITASGALVVRTVEGLEQHRSGTIQIAKGGKP